VATGPGGSLEIVSDEIGEAAREVRSALEWAQVRAMAADGVSKSEIARRLGINRRTVKRLVEAPEPPSYSRAPAGSMLDPLEPVLRRLLADWPDIKAPRVTEILRDDYGYAGSVDLVRKRLAALRPRSERPAQKTGYRPGQVLQVDWAEMPTRPRIAGRERRVYALVCSLPFSGAATAHFSFDMTIESFLEGHVRAFDWLGGVPRECVYDNLRSAVAKRERVDGRDVVTWNTRFSQLRGHYAFHATACTPETPREKGSSKGPSGTTRQGSGQRGTSRTWPSSTSFTRLGATGSPCRAVTRPAAMWSPTGLRTSASSCGRCRPSRSIRPGGARRGCRPTATSSTDAASTARRRR
jgi:transposase